MTEKLRVEQRPCSTCPFVVNTPPGVWDASEYETLAAYDNPHHLKGFLCHHSALGSAEAVCRGWLALFPDGLGARLFVSVGLLDDDDRWIPLPDDVVLYESGTAARDAGLAASRRPTTRRAGCEPAVGGPAPTSANAPVVVTDIDPTKRAQVEAAARAAEERHPGLSRTISACLVGWPDLDIPPVVHQALLVKIGEYIDEHAS